MPSDEAADMIERNRSLDGLRGWGLGMGGQLLREPWEVRADSGAPFKVFTAFWRRHGALGAFPPPLPAPERLVAAPWPDMAPARVDLADLGLAPVKPDWFPSLKILRA